MKRYSLSDIIAIVISLTIMVVGMFNTPAGFTNKWPIFFFGFIAVFMLLRPSLEQYLHNPHQEEKIVFNDQELIRYIGEELIEKIAWSDVTEIIIKTTDVGPFYDDIFWLFLSENQLSSCVVPETASGFSALLEHIQTLPNFDNEAVIEAMGSTSNASFTVWSSSFTKS